MIDKENGLTVTVNGGQFNISKDDSTLYVTQYNVDNNSRLFELENIIKTITDNVYLLEKQKADELIDIVDIIKTELIKPVPQPSRLRNCLTLLGPMFTVANGIPVLIENLHKLQEIILPLIK